MNASAGSLVLVSKAISVTALSLAVFGTANVAARAGAIATVASPDSSSAATPAIAVLAAVKGEVRVERAGSGAPLQGSIGLRLQAGDTVRVGAGGSSATVYLAGGGLVRVPAGSRIEIPSEVDGGSRVSGGSAPGAGSSAVPGGASLTASMSSRSVEVLEAGLWILNDPQGSVLLSAMRGEGDAWDDAGTDGPGLLSPRYETVLEPRPRFVWSGSGPVRPVIARAKEIVWRGPPSSGGALAIPGDAPELRAGEIYRWWLESSEGGSPLTESIPFRVADRKIQSEAARFEKEIAGFGGDEDGKAVANLLRCGYYIEVGAWTRVVAAASDLRRRDPSSPVAERALDGSRLQMRLGEEALARLAPPGPGQAVTP